MADQPAIPEKLQWFTFLMDRYGPTMVFCVFLGWILTHQLKDMKKQMDRIVQNQRSVMTKIGIAYTLEPDK